MGAKAHTYLLFALAVLFVVTFLYPIFRVLVTTGLKRVGATGAARYVDASN